MLRGLRRILATAITIAGGIMIWQWIVRKLRRPAPAPESLLRPLPEAVHLWRNGDRLHIAWDTPQRDTRITVTPIHSPDARQSITSDSAYATIEGINQERYQVRVCFPDGRELSAQESASSLLRVPNFRDIGGYSTRDGRRVRRECVYRASALDQLTTDDQAQLAALGIRLVCDIRTMDESLAHPDQLPADIELLQAPPHSNDNRWVQLFKLLYVPATLESLLYDLYTRVMIDNNPQVFRAIFRRLAQADSYPLVIHCAAGKDRAGITTALLLRILGVPDETIIADYTLSNHHYDFFRHTSRKVMAQLKIVGLDERDFNHLLIADGDMMRDTLAHIDHTYGSAEAYLTRYAGLKPAELEAIRKHLLE